MNNNNNGGKLKGIIIIGVFIAVIAMFVGSCGSCGGSSSKTKWSDLSKEEQDNARWAYYAKQAEENYNK